MGHWSVDSRPERRHRLGGDDQRNPFERDGDRVLYSSAFRRLNGITQIVRANEADIFHNRLSHTLKVAQVGRRMADHLTNKFPVEAEDLGLSSDVVGAACLIHDLGHPPFGHVGEKILDKLLVDEGDSDGFEGNAQSFRIVTRLAVRFEEELGLDLTRATLRASLKYPWLRVPGDKDRGSKWGAYKTDQNDFDFAMSQSKHVGKSTEAALMDWSDDIAYSVHDMEDMHRARLIPWTAVMTEVGRETLVAKAAENWHDAPTDAVGRLRDAYKRVKLLIETTVPGMLLEPYNGQKEHRREIRFLTSTLIGRYLGSTTLSLAEPTGLLIRPEMADEVRLLKQLARSYFIANPSLAAQQHGQKKVLSDLFHDILGDKKNTVVPIRFRHLFEGEEAQRPRAVADLIGGLTETEAIGFHKRLRGTDAGSVLDPIVW